MKTNNSISKTICGLVMAISLVAFLGSCSSKKMVTKIDRKEIDRPFSDFVSDKKTFRAVGIQTSPDMSFAIEMAGNDARQQLAAQINSFVQNRKMAVLTATSTQKWRHWVTILSNSKSAIP